MSNRRSFLYGVVVACGLSLIGQQIAAAATPSELDRLITQENAGRKIQVAPLLDDLGFLRRVTVDVIGRIPTEVEIKQYLAWPADQRRGKIIDALLKNDRFADRWTVFLADMLRIRSNAEGGALLMAFVHKAVETGMPYDEMCRRMISANGKPGRTPEVGFILGDNADPMALAGVTAQVFLGIRVACAQCHDHPFDVWKRKQFYGFAAFFGKTRRIESQLTGAVYTTETNQTTVLWPPEDAADGKKRVAMKPSFPFATISEDETPEYISRLLALRAAQAKATSGDRGDTVNALLASAEDKINNAANGAKLPSILNVDGDVKLARQKINLLADRYKRSLLRHKLAEMVTSPRNRYFAKCLTNRVWSELLGRGFVEPLDDFSEENAPSHPQTLDYLADEFVAGGYDLRNLLKLIFTSHAYQRARLRDVKEPLRLESEAAFAAGRARRMLAESLYDSIVQAGHLFEYKYPAGANKKTIRRLVRIAIPLDPKLAKIEPEPKQTVAKVMVKQMTPAPDAYYDLESAVELDFDALLKAKSDEPVLEKMRIMSKEEIEAMRMLAERKPQGGPRMRYVDRYKDFVIDDNPKFSSAMRMASPAPAAHFLRIFGQPARANLGDFRSEMASMRQALMMLNGKLTNEASRVGDFEPVFSLLVGKKADVNAAIKLVYREILTREPSSEEFTEAKAILASGDNARAGMADLRWVLFNCHEFKFVP